MDDPCPPATPSAPSASSTAFIGLLRLASPALPVGGFSYSEGLEAAVDAGRVVDEASAGPWLVDQLRLSLGRADLRVVSEAFMAWSAGDAAAAGRLNDWACHTRETSELTLQAEQMGRSLQAWLQQRHAGDPRVGYLGAMTPAPTWPVAFALGAVLSGAPLRDALLAHAFGWAENMVQAAIKAVPLGQSAGQRMLDALSAAIPEVVEQALAAGAGQRQSYAPMLAILSSQHEAQYSRLFRS